MKCVMLIYQGSTPPPGSEASNALGEDALKQIYADYAAVNQTPGVTDGPFGGMKEVAPFERVSCE
ncbi:MAG TPA: hypothetical protein VMF09_16635 [Solirubrobacteraceae bacterium]|nr:hypothetical protein [Solirubrobacteraceae bacterium]